MKNGLRWVTAAVLVLASGAAFANRPGERYPNLIKSWEAIQKAKDHIKKAEAFHAPHGGLGGHGAEAVRLINGAETEIDQAVMFAETHHKPGPPGVVTPKPPLVAHPDDAKYRNLGDARLQVEWAIRHIEDAMQYHGPTGSLGGHGEKATEMLRGALHEIGEAEHFADAHH